MDKPNISKATEARVFGAYFLALGEFNNAFTGVEHLLTCCVKNTLSREMRDDRNEWLVNAIVGSMRMSPAKDTVKRILRVQGAPVARRLFVDKVFAHLGDIQWLRDRIAHNATLLRGDDQKHMLISFDFASAREAEKSEFVGFMPPVLRAASHDLVVIKALIDDLMSMHHGSIPETDLKLPAWQYRPSLLVRRRPKSSESRKPRKPPPRSSHE